LYRDVDQPKPALSAFALDTPHITDISGFEEWHGDDDGIEQAIHSLKI
jgi:hypothetical protein